jgi:hypothetical protein
VRVLGGVVDGLVLMFFPPRVSEAGEGEALRAAAWASVGTASTNRLQV